MPETAPVIAVITGDLVESSRLNKEERSRVLDCLQTVAFEAVEHFPGLLESNDPIYRGDSWQVVTRRPADALHVAVLFRARLLSLLQSSRVDSRIAIGIGGYESLDPRHLSHSSGAAFTLSGRLLGELGSDRRRLGVRMEEGTGLDGSAFDTVAVLVDALTERWTDRQALAVSGALVGLRQAEIAELWCGTDRGRRITQASVARHLERADWLSIQQGLAWFNHSLSKL